MHRPLPRDKWLRRFSEAVALLRDGAVPPAPLCERWADGDRSPLEHWAASKPSLPWISGSKALRAAQLLVGEMQAVERDVPPRLSTAPAEGAGSRRAEWAEAAAAVRAIKCSPVTLAFAMSMAIRGVDFRKCSKKMIAESFESGAVAGYIERRGLRPSADVPMRRVLLALEFAIPHVVKHQTRPNRAPVFPTPKDYMTLLEQTQAILYDGASVPVGEAGA